MILLAKISINQNAFSIQIFHIRVDCVANFKISFLVPFLTLFNLKEK